MSPTSLLDSSRLGEVQTVPARFAAAAFVPKDYTIKVINTYGSQVLATWAFPVASVDVEKVAPREAVKRRSSSAAVKASPQSPEGIPSKNTVPWTQWDWTRPLRLSPDNKYASIAKRAKLETQTEAKLASPARAESKDKEVVPEVKKISSSPEGWSSYLSFGSAADGRKRPVKSPSAKDERESRSRLEVKPYLLGETYQRDPTRSYAEQLHQLSRTPLGSAGLTGESARPDVGHTVESFTDPVGLTSAATGSGYSSALLAAYNAYGTMRGSLQEYKKSEFLSMPHTAAVIQHIYPRLGDTLLTNHCGRILTVVEDISPGHHGIILAAADPALAEHLKDRGISRPETCAENLTDSLREFNISHGLRLPDFVGDFVEVDRIPTPLCLFQSTAINAAGDIFNGASKCRKGDYIKLRADQDCLVVLSACPNQDIMYGAGKPMAAHFIVESPHQNDVMETRRREAEAQEVIQKAKERVERDAADRVKPRKIRQYSGSRVAMLSKDGDSSRPSTSRSDMSEPSSMADDIASGSDVEGRVDASRNLSPPRKQPRKLELRSRATSATPTDSSS